MATVLIVPGTYGQFWLDASQTVHQLSRQVVIAALPGNISTGAPRAFGIDFGEMTQTITIRGIVYDAAPASYFTTVWNLLHTLRYAWKDFTVAYNAVQSPQNTVLVTYWRRSGAVYTYKTIYQGGVMQKRAGDTYWGYSLTFQVIAWPPSGSGA